MEWMYFQVDVTAWLTALSPASDLISIVGDVGDCGFDVHAGAHRIVSPITTVPARRPNPGSIMMAASPAMRLRVRQRSPAVRMLYGAPAPLAPAGRSRASKRQASAQIRRQANRCNPGSSRQPSGRTRELGPIPRDAE